MNLFKLFLLSNQTFLNMILPVLSKKYLLDILFGDSYLCLKRLECFCVISVRFGKVKLLFTLRPMFSTHYYSILRFFTGLVRAAFKV